MRLIYSLRDIGDLELIKDVADFPVYRAPAYEQFPGNILVAQATRHQSKDLNLTPGEQR